MTQNNKIGKVLIANRGEIALRIQRACRKLQIPTVSIVSEADRNTLFAREAEQLVVIGPAAPKDSYLAMDKIIAAAKQYGCDAIHPGYGFLSENSEFAAKVEASGLNFIGPSSQSIKLLGSKTAAKELARKANVPTSPSCGAGLSDQELVQAASKIGFPLLIKAVAGGGGRGMRRVETIEELKENIPRARGEAKKFFSNEDIYLERYIDRPRHVEVQIFGDKHGNLIHLGTRDCSTQRRHQKLIEEAPAPNLSDSLRDQIHQAAVRAGKAANYWSAGTVEFLVKGEEFFFLEVNTRIQVEHPVTEIVTGLDLVELQLRVARGEKLPVTQEQVKFTGHAIEFRICAEDPTLNFSPSRGRISEWVRQPSEFVREDTGFAAGDEISTQYDSMISKVIVNGHSREISIAKSIEYLKSYHIKGLITSVEFHRWVLYNGLFQNSPLDIGYVEREFSVSKIEELRAGDLRDPRWQEPIGGAVVKNVYEYRSERFETTYTIEIVHKRDGFFVAIPVGADGRRGKNANCRMSNGLNTVMKSLINDVLEKTPPAEIFN